jgi:hypothetical protein
LGEAEEHMALHNLACVEPRRERSGYAQQISMEALAGDWGEEAC